jgi:hypothetical protein
MMADIAFILRHCWDDLSALGGSQGRSARVINRFHKNPLNGNDMWVGDRTELAVLFGFSDRRGMTEFLSRNRKNQTSEVKQNGHSRIPGLSRQDLLLHLAGIEPSWLSESNEDLLARYNTSRGVRLAVQEETAFEWLAIEKGIGSFQEHILSAEAIAADQVRELPTSRAFPIWEQDPFPLPDGVTKIDLCKENLRLKVTARPGVSADGWICALFGIEQGTSKLDERVFSVIPKYAKGYYQRDVNKGFSIHLEGGGLEVAPLAFAPRHAGMVLEYIVFLFAQTPEMVREYKSYTDEFRTPGKAYIPMETLDEWAALMTKMAKDGNALWSKVSVFPFWGSPEPG